MYIWFKFMDTYCLKKLHNTRFNDVVINELKSLILLIEVLQEIEAVANEEQWANEEIAWK